MGQIFRFPLRQSLCRHFKLYAGEVQQEFGQRHEERLKGIGRVDLSGKIQRFF